ncbi:MAG: FAD/NAD(P)-binding oxidoreductase, partial [Anaerolineales bacterium]
MTRYIIIGTGVAGIAAAEAIRSTDPAGDIMLIGNDPHGFYSRPGLAYYLTGELPEAQLFPYPPQQFRKLRLHVRRGRVTRLLADTQEVELDDRTRLPYDRLLLATGARAVPPSVPGADLTGVVKLDHLDDARRIIGLARRAKR